MEKTRILLISNDEFYSERLVDCIRQMKTRIKISRFNMIKNYTSENLMDELSKANISSKSFNEFKIILIDTDDREKYFVIKNLINNCFFELDSVILRLTSSATNQEEYDIYKYLKVSELINKAIQKYGFVKSSYIPGHITKSEKTKLYSICSSKGGSGVSSISLSLARELALRKEDNILYLNIGYYHQERYFFQWSRSNNLREYIFHMFYGDNRYCFSLDNYIKNDEFGVYHFNVNTFTNKVNELSNENFIKFIENIISLNLFHIIVFDLGSDITDKVKYLLDISDRIFFIDRNNHINRDDYLSFLEIDMEKCLFIENFALVKSDIDEFFEENEDSVENYHQIEYNFRIRRDEEAFFLNENLYDIRRDTLFSEDISKIVDEVFL